jgi:endonuclease YncB( thermonuclease family)
MGALRVPSYLGLCVMVAALLPGCADARLLPGAPTETGGRVETAVSRVVDGDTVEIAPRVQGNDTVRLIGAYTPERGEPLYAEAAGYARESRSGNR